MAQLQTILDWIKRHLPIVICAVVSIAALVVFPMLATGINDSVKNEIRARDRFLNSLSSLKSSEFSLPTAIGQQATSFQTVISGDHVKRYEADAALLKQDAESVVMASLAHNQKGRTVLLAELFPEPPAQRREVLPEKFHESITDAYAALLNSIGAGLPPDREAVEADIERARRQFIWQMLAKDDEPLTDEEAEQVQQQMSKARLALYRDRAESISLYMGPESLLVLPPEEFVRGAAPTVGEMFIWQWEFWAVQDLLLAVKEINGPRSELQSPIKRVLSLAIGGLPVPTDEPAGGQGRGGRGGSGRGGNSNAGDPLGPLPIHGGQAAPAKQAPSDFAASLTGRVSNPLYDVIPAQLSMIVRTGDIPLIVDDLSAYNFISISDLVMESADPFQDLGDGFIYGSGGLSRLTLTCQLIYLRTWTTEFMPDTVKNGLMIPVDRPRS